MLPSRGTPRGWLCTSTEMVSHVVMYKERRHSLPGTCTMFGIKIVKIFKELCHILKLLFVKKIQCCY